MTINPERWASFYRFARVAVLIWAGTLVYLQSDEILTLRNTVNYLDLEITHLAQDCVEYIQQDREMRQIKPRSH